MLTDATGIEAIVEATGEVEFGAGVAVRAIDGGKHIILVNAELDSCLGPILKTRADAAGVVLTDMAGDQPAVIMDLIDEVRLLGFRPILAGNIKSLLDHKRTPETQKAFAEAHGQRAEDDHILRRRHQDRGRDGGRRQRDRLRGRHSRHARTEGGASRAGPGAVRPRVARWSTRSSTTSSGPSPASASSSSATRRTPRHART